MKQQLANKLARRPENMGANGANFLDDTWSSYREVLTGFLSLKVAISFYF